jgi:hypothetical protein
MDKIRKIGYSETRHKGRSLETFLQGFHHLTFARTPSGNQRHQWSENSTTGSKLCNEAGNRTNACVPLPDRVQPGWFEFAAAIAACGFG